MADSNEAKLKNLVYLMIKRYKGGWREKFPSDMGIPVDKCEKIYDAYYDTVLEEIEKEAVDGSDVPSADALIKKGLRKLDTIITTCEDPSKLARAIEMLRDMRDADPSMREAKETIFDKIQRKAKDANQQSDA